MAALFPTLVYTLCFATAALCAYLLGRGYRRVRSRMLFWSATCFVLLAVANFMVILDMLIFPDINFRPWRLGITLVGVSVLLFGFIWDEDS